MIFPNKIHMQKGEKVSNRKKEISLSTSRFPRRKSLHFIAEGSFHFIISRNAC